VKGDGIKSRGECADPRVGLCYCFPEDLFYVAAFLTLVVERCRGCSQLLAILSVLVGDGCFAVDVRGLAESAELGQGVGDLGTSVFLHISFQRFLVLVQAKKAKKVKKSQAKQGRSKF
jgi:hypothetical protein